MTHRQHLEAVHNYFLDSMVFHLFEKKLLSIILRLSTGVICEAQDRLQIERARFKSYTLYLTSSMLQLQQNVTPQIAYQYNHVASYEITSSSYLLGFCKDKQKRGSEKTCSNIFRFPSI